MPRTTLPTILLVLALAASACSSSPTSTAPAASDAEGASSAPSTAPEPSTDGEGVPAAGTDLTACEIVTAEDIATTLGVEVADIGEGELSETPTSLSPGRTECEYSGEWGGVIVSLTPEDGANLYDAARGSYGDASDREVAGADGAFWSESQKRGFFWKGAVTVMLQVGFLAGGGDRDGIVTALGQAAMDRVR